MLLPEAKTSAKSNHQDPPDPQVITGRQPLWAWDVQCMKNDEKQTRAQSTIHVKIHIDIR